MSEKRILPAFLLCLFFGVFGAHRFFVKKTGTALLQLFTIGGLGIWACIDLVLLVCGAFEDKEGKQLKKW
jgi:TM2 domain-containing membrane protein YozV